MPSCPGSALVSRRYSWGSPPHHSELCMLIADGGKKETCAESGDVSARGRPIVRAARSHRGIRLRTSVKVVRALLELGTLEVAVPRGAPCMARHATLRTSCTFQLGGWMDACSPELFSGLASGVRYMRRGGPVVVLARPVFAASSCSPFRSILAACLDLLKPPQARVRSVLVLLLLPLCT